MFAVLLTGLAAFAADPPPTAVQTAVARIEKATEYTLKVAIPGGGEKVVPFVAKTDKEDTSWAGWRVVPYLLAIATATHGKGEVRLSFEFPGQKEPLVLRSKGLAEDVYLLRAFGREQEAAKWLDTVAPQSKLVVPWPKDEPDEVGERLEKVPDELVAAVRLGVRSYEAKRPELIRRFNTSYLYYPPTVARDWSVFAGKDRLWIVTGCHDRMYAARFRVELKKTATGEWEVTRILAKEFFKGE